MMMVPYVIFGRGSAWMGRRGKGGHYRRYCLDVVFFAVDSAVG